MPLLALLHAQGVDVEGVFCRLHHAEPLLPEPQGMLLQPGGQLRSRIEGQIAARLELPAGGGQQKEELLFAFVVATLAVETYGAVVVAQPHPTMAVAAGLVVHVAVSETEQQHPRAVDGRFDGQHGLGRQVDVFNQETLGIDFRRGHLLENKSPEIVVFHPFRNVHRPFLGEGRKQFPAERLAQEQYFPPKGERAGLPGQHVEALLKGVVVQLAADAQVQGVGDALVVTGEVHDGRHHRQFVNLQAVGGLHAAHFVLGIYNADAQALGLLDGLDERGVGQVLDVVPDRLFGLLPKGGFLSPHLFVGVTGKEVRGLCGLAGHDQRKEVGVAVTQHF